MGQIDGVEALQPLPDRFAIAEFSPMEADAIRGINPAEHALNVSNFNWVAAYLVDQVGLYEGEVKDWFQSQAEGLGWESPMHVWGRPDGYQQVFDYAKAYKKQVDENLASEQS